MIHSFHYQGEIPWSDTILHQRFFKSWRTNGSQVRYRDYRSGISQISQFRSQKSGKLSFYRIFTMVKSVCGLGGPLARRRKVAAWLPQSQWAKEKIKFISPVFPTIHYSSNSPANGASKTVFLLSGRSKNRSSPNQVFSASCLTPEACHPGTAGSSPFSWSFLIWVRG